ncbi:unnamed protein product [Rotaria sp. Silwood2]|nr:unnamed protein product [Rotaria sp. Silwood2]CAF3012878.1 unnamed protein product [Rotaria sp. Silwood2]CAF4021150.1 unnamed protein product [Rotaria sp. Silwood2]CAF4086081.1 unnamed protein product [Rotaria sp. Silwood2]CAF4094419.1 unnamed protein product [Rotaria sp. Silwood2]
MSSEYERKLIDMQYQMRENNAYLNDYMKDLNTWTDEIKKKEESLKNTTSSTTKDLPPVRNFIEPPKPKKKSKKKNSSTKTSSSIRSHDYHSWDKYDVDAECKRIDNEQGDGDDEDEEDEEDEEWQEQVLKQKAEYYKDCGNYQFKQKSYAQAIEHYTKAIECDPTCPIYFANRAQCQLFEQRYGACEADCTLAIQLDKNYLKAYYRRALARIEIEKIEQARQDLEYILTREPSNNDAKNKLDELNKNDEIKRLGRIYPLHDKPIDKRSTKPLKRIEIQEIDTSIISSSETTKKKTIVIEEMDTDLPSSEPIVPPSSSPSPPPPPPSPSSQSEKPTVTEKPSTKSVPIPTTIPTTGFQFKRDWSNLNNQLEQQSIYFNKIPPKSYKTIFSTGLDSSVFSRILLLWSNQTNIDEHLIDSMYELHQTPRFDTQLSFLGNDDKKLLKTILQRLQNEFSSTDKIQTVLRDYKID